MELTTEKVINLLPISFGAKQKLMAQYQEADGSGRFEIENVVWDAYYAYYQLRLQENLRIEFIKARSGKEMLDSEFYSKVQAITEKQMKEDTQANLAESELSSVREKLSALIGDSQ